MTEGELEEELRNLCDDSGIALAEVVSVLDALKVEYQMRAADEEPDAA